jgi:hypothetical protein
VERIDRRDHDRCLAVMPATGGTLRRLVCVTKPSSDDTLDAFTTPSPGPDGRVAFVYSTYDLFAASPYHSRLLMVGGLDTPLVRDNRMIVYPVRVNGGFTHDGVAEIAWRTPGSLVYLAILPHYPQPCKTCRPDAATPVEIVLVDLGPDSGTAAALPNTLFATSFALQGTDTLYFTVLGDARVFRRVLSSGEETLVHDFGLNTIARDLQVYGDNLVVIVGGDVNVELLVGIGYIQNDDGGFIHVLRLSDSVETVVGGQGRLFRRAALSPDGRTLLAESRDGPGDDWDIWRIELP